MAPLSKPNSSKPARPATSAPGNPALQIAVWIAALAACLAAFDLVRNAIRLHSPPPPEEVAAAVRTAHTTAPRATRLTRSSADGNTPRHKTSFDPNFASPFVDPSQSRPTAMAAPFDPNPAPAATPLDETEVLQEMHEAGALRQISDHQALMLSDLYWQSDADPASGARLSLEDIERIRREGLIVR